jgi:subtilisin family serine protease
MKHKLTNNKLFLLLNILLFLLILPTTFLSAQSNKITSEYIVLRSSQNPDVFSGFAIEVIRLGEETWKITVAKPTESNQSEAEIANKAENDCAKLKELDPTIELCELNTKYKVNRRLPNDPYFLFQEYLDGGDGSDGVDLDAPEGWALTVGTNLAIVAVIDSGIDLGHPDLVTSVWKNSKEKPNNGIDEDKNGYIDDYNGLDTVAGDDVPDSLPQDCDGHGTGISGIIAARGDNADGIAGINWNAKIIPIRAFDCYGDATSESILKAYEYVYALKKFGVNIQIINASFGNPEFSAVEERIIKKLASVNVLVVTASGNDGLSLDEYPIYPGSYNLDNIINVGSVNSGGELSVFSNFSKKSVDIAAPGEEIFSTWSAIGYPAEPYNYTTGTSFAAPHVAGALSIIYSLNPYMHYEKVKNILFSSTKPLPSIKDKVANAGVPSLPKLLSNVAAFKDQCPNDNNKLTPGVCGCGKPELYNDADQDGRFDCVDNCPNDPVKSEKGVCGCGKVDVDNNRNGIIDCIESGVIPTPTPTTFPTNVGGIFNINLKKAFLKKHCGKLVISMQKFKKDVSYVVEVAQVGLQPKYFRTTNPLFMANIKRDGRVQVRYRVIFASGRKTPFSSFNFL